MEMQATADMLAAMGTDTLGPLSHVGNACPPHAPRLRISSRSAENLEIAHPGNRNGGIFSRRLSRLLDLPTAHQQD